MAILLNLSILCNLGANAATQDSAPLVIESQATLKLSLTN